MKSGKYNIVIYGASGHGKVIADMIEKNNGIVCAFADDNSALWGSRIMGYNVWAGTKQLINEFKTGKLFSVVIGIGNNPIRRKIQVELEKEGISFATVIHPSAQVAREVHIGEGTVVMAGGIINPGSIVGKHCIVNTSVSIDHDCKIGDFVHISPGAHLGGTVSIGSYTWIGLGASIINNLSIGENTIVGAGAVVIRNVESGCVVAGNPAGVIKQNTPLPIDIEIKTESEA